MFLLFHVNLKRKYIEDNCFIFVSYSFAYARTGGTFGTASLCVGTASIGAKNTCQI